MIGQTISHYKIIEKLGEGGMGIVYKAQDSKLDRFVALKFLPQYLGAEEDRTRFIHEAKAASALDHPNIGTIYEIGETDDGQLFIAMAYYAGETLKQKIDHGPLPVDEAARIALQLCEGLSRAHEAGITHRDIKPANIIITDRGEAKIVDFGLAKLTGQTKVTKTGATVGTTAYMSPEQIIGETVDGRSDIFSVGIVIYEMLTGRLPFRGEHEAAMVYSIVNEHPQDISAFTPELSPIVANLIQRCLEKDPAERYQHFDDITADLKRAQKKTSKVMRISGHVPVAPAGQGAPPAEMAPQPPTSIRAGRKPIGLIVLGTVVLAAIAVAFWLLSSPSLPEINPRMEVSMLQIPATEYQYPGISPDGKWLAFPGADLNGNWDIYMMLIETGENKRITSDSSLTLGNAATASFSPDGSSIVYGRLRQGMDASEVCVVSVLTGLVRVIADTGIAPVWSPVSDRIYYYRGAGLRAPARSQWREYWSVTPQGTDARIEFVDSLMMGGLAYFTMGISPDGKKFAFTRPMGPTFNEIIVHDLTTGAQTQLTNDRKIIDEVVWLNNGYILYSSNRSGNFNIWAMPESGGGSTQITRGAGPDFGISFSSVANRLIFSQRSGVSTLWMVNTDGTGYRQVYPDENIGGSHISPDGKSVVLSISHATLWSTLMIRDLSTARQEILFPHDSSFGRVFPAWSPSGQSVSFLEVRPGNLFTAKIISLAGGRRVQDFGKGAIVHWFSDSSVIILRDTSSNASAPQYDVPMSLNTGTHAEEAIRPLAIPVLNNTKMLILGENAETARLLSRQDFQRDPNAAGTLIFKRNERSWSDQNDQSMYYLTSPGNAFWRFSFSTLKRTKIVDLPPGYRYNVGNADYNDKVLTFSQSRLKTNIVKVDNVFMK